ncbi:nuclear transport factor 2 family protein [Winogradskyella sp. UBA3174]|uniref:nuclear transport factor 2 family protein n=1 Tax=Winogradskyella sp. UBA3174 TaxID=1947785 RepID=UPI0025FF1AAD|nr:nuclear transport factor 2 family protein [Winogradskyella sp. UBA3174]|tara:strand:- start:5494 stop:5904 length:411 start_codon:yes stop_codon:yes gene_type:complete
MKKITPPFTEKTAKAKVQAAEDAWNSKNPEKVAMAYAIDSQWRNRDLLFTGRKAIAKFLSDKWKKELHYKLKKYLWSFTENRISVRFEYEWQDAKSGQWQRTHGNEHWEFNNEGLMQIRDMSANDIEIEKHQRKFK